MKILYVQNMARVLLNDLFYTMNFGSEIYVFAEFLHIVLLEFACYFAESTKF